jgi:urease gamma subunit
MRQEQGKIVLRSTPKLPNERDEHGVRAKDNHMAVNLAAELYEHLTGQTVADLLADPANPATEKLTWVVAKLHELLQEAAKPDES